MPNPNPEQTASLFSLIFYFFMDSLMFLGYRLPHLPVERLPPLSDYDRAKHLIKGAFPVSVYGRLNEGAGEMSRRRSKRNQF